MNYIKHFGTLVTKNAPTILTAFGSAGVLTTAIMAVKATPEAMRRINNTEINLDRNLTRWETVKVAGPVYIPAAIMATTSIACIIGANSVNLRKQAALASLYTISEKSFQEFREKAAEQLGKTKAEKIHDGVIEDRVLNTPGSEVVILGGGEVLCLETLSGRFFNSTAETIRKAQNDVNAQSINEMYASMNDFYRMIGLPQIPMGEEVGWNTDNMLELKLTSALTEDNKPVLAIDYVHAPKPDYFRIWT